MRTRQAAGLWLIGSALLLVPGAAQAQVAYSDFSNPYRINGYYAAPGYYGMAYGSPSVGLTRTYTTFSTPYGMGYGAGYAPYGLLPGRYGVGLWRPGLVTPGYVYGVFLLSELPRAVYLGRCRPDGADRVLCAGVRAAVTAVVSWGIERPGLLVTTGAAPRIAAT